MRDRRGRAGSMFRADKVGEGKQYKKEVKQKDGRAEANDLSLP